MDRRKTGIIALAATGVLAASAAVALNVPTSGTMVATEEAAVAEAVAATNLHGTNYTLTEQYIAFTLDEAGALVATGDTAQFDQSILDGVTAQLAAAPAYSAVIVDTGSLDSDGLTTVLTTVTPTNGMTLTSTNEEMQQWLAGLFPGVEGTMTSQDVPNVPNAAFSYPQPADEISWTVTEYIYQFGDATVSARVSCADASGETQTAIDQLLAGITRG